MKILHCHSTFNLGGKEARAVRLMNVFADAASHTILSAVPGAFGARAAIDETVRVDFPDDAPPLHGKPSPGRYWRLARYMQRFDLVLTYNWGAMDAVGARRMFPRHCPPLIHHEDGFNEDEREKLNWKRNAFRRLMLPTAHALVVPSVRLEEIARSAWRVDRPVRIGNGINTASYAIPPAPDAIPGLVKAPGDLVIGTLAGLRAIKNLPRLVRAAAGLAPQVRLVIIGEGPEREAIMAEAARVGLGDRLIMPGFLAEPGRYIGLFDIFALSSDSEQFPISLVEAMAAGLPAVSTDVGDVRALVSDAGRDFIVARTDEAGLADALGRLVADPALRRSIGQANQAKASASFDEATMIARYWDLYAGAIAADRPKSSSSLST
jgi:glycosyltransferase involved in cell wall biosynthesis